jgi:hypothetical protein
LQTWQGWAGGNDAPALLAMLCWLAIGLPGRSPKRNR